MYMSKFVVEGRGHFPLDMLRYDSCWPSTQSDVAALDYIREDFRKPPNEKSRRVALSRCHKTKGFKPTSDRWESFGWHIVELSGPYRVN